MTVARRFGTAKGKVNLGANRRSVDIEDSGVSFVHRVEGAVYVLRVNRRGQPVLHAVRYFDCLIQRLRRNYRSDGAEDLFLGDAHVWLDVGEDCRLDEIAMSVVTFGQLMAAARQRRAV